MFKYMNLLFIVFFFKHKTAYDVRIIDWSSDVCSSDLTVYVAVLPDDPAYVGAQIFDRLRSAVGSPGVYAVSLGDRFGAASDSSVIPGGTAQIGRASCRERVRQHV